MHTEQDFMLYIIQDDIITRYTKNSLDLDYIRFRNKITIITRPDNKNKIRFYSSYYEQINKIYLYNIIP